MESFDQSLKYLLDHEPHDLIRFAVGGEPVEVLEPVAVALPSRGREIDGGYRVRVAGALKVAHVEFQRRHQAQRELAVDVAEAQVRLFRREQTEVLSVVWDLYGKDDDPVLSRCALAFATGSRSEYTRVNLRGMGWRELLAKGPPALWPLVALAGGGACDDAVHAARDAIVAREDLSATRKADHLAVLWFVAEAEDVAVKLMQAYIREEELMQSGLYQEIFSKGERKGRLEGRLEGLQQAIVDLCEVLGVELTPEREALLQQLDLDQLTALRTHLKRDRAWTDPRA